MSFLGFAYRTVIAFILMFSGGIKILEPLRKTTLNEVAFMHYLCKYIRLEGSAPIIIWRFLGILELLVGIFMAASSSLVPVYISIFLFLMFVFYKLLASKELEHRSCGCFGTQMVASRRWANLMIDIFIIVIACFSIYYSEPAFSISERILYASMLFTVSIISSNIYLDSEKKLPKRKDVRESHPVKYEMLRDKVANRVKKTSVWNDLSKYITSVRETDYWFEGLEKLIHYVVFPARYNGQPAIAVFVLLSGEKQVRCAGTILSENT